jgi:hypothetical protein
VREQRASLNLLDFFGLTGVDCGAGGQCRIIRISGIANEPTRYDLIFAKDCPRIPR